MKVDSVLSFFLKCQKKNSEGNPSCKLRSKFFSTRVFVVFVPLHHSNSISHRKLYLDLTRQFHLRETISPRPYLTLKCGRTRIACKQLLKSIVDCLLCRTHTDIISHNKTTHEGLLPLFLFKL